MRQVLLSPPMVFIFWGKESELSLLKLVYLIDFSALISKNFQSNDILICIVFQEDNDCDS